MKACPCSWPTVDYSHVLKKGERVNGRSSRKQIIATGKDGKKKKETHEENKYMCKSGLCQRQRQARKQMQERRREMR